MDTLNTVDSVETAVESSFDAEGNITDANMASALTGGKLDLPEVEKLTEPEGQEVSKEPTEPEKKAEEPTGVMSKSGESIIPYADLIKERDGRHAERDRANDLQYQLDELVKKMAGEKEPLSEEQEEEPKNEMAEALEAMFEDYPESKGILEGLSNSNVNLTKQLGELQEQINKVSESSAASTHFKAINDAHSNAESILTSEEFTSWIDGITSPIVAEAYQAIYKQGTSTQVVSMLDDYLAAAKKPDAPKPADPKEVAEKVAKAEAEAEKNKKPGSLSDVSGKPSPHEGDAAILDLSQANFMDKMSNLSSADQLALLDKMM